ncbi:hypothetical protein [Effusibacillus pohliae]|uniref:hypothetical protein n=1 Tax=Effusibacillus pohliae TaxID=232270 RepID=UPI0012E9D4E0|nr:hypothetical protein [Effusibacillus pohliae]
MLKRSLHEQIKNELKEAKWKNDGVENVDGKTAPASQSSANSLTPLAKSFREN